MIGLLEQLEEMWNNIDQVHPFEAQFIDECIAKSYREYTIIFKIIGFLSVLTISIAGLGLLGMAIYAAESRMKEISIRKVLGASEWNLVLLLSKSFSIMIIFSGVAAAIITYLLFDRIVFADVANNVTIGILELGLGFVVTFLIGL